MLEQQREAEKQKDLSIKAAAHLAKKREEMSVRKKKVDEDLGKAEPALIAAQQSVSGIQRKDLVEMTNYKNPPAKVALALEPVVCLLSKRAKKPDWMEIKTNWLKKSDFTSLIMNFEKDDIPTPVKTFVMQQYLKDEKAFDVDQINKASKAAGPLALWVKSIVIYSDIYHSITPLREELAQLAKEEVELADTAKELEDKIVALEKNIENLKAEYAGLIAKVETIKADMKQVQEKVDRSVQLIKNLSSERIRWEESSQNFNNQMSCLVGDTLFASAFLTYIGFFDHYYRGVLNSDWSDSLEMSCIKMRSDIKFIEFLSTPSERLIWEQQALPNDTLCIENVIIIKKFNRYPLIIDPSDQAFKFVMNHHQDQKINKTSFADDGFMKNLESAIRFGLPLLVQDVEKIDPVLNSVLNKEVQKAGGRILIRVGDQEIDYSDKFILYMHTRDPNAFFTPDLCSRVTFVNFTVTPSSLQNQCLQILLKEERPEIDKKRNDIIKLQGEFRVKLRNLEDQLLNELNQSEGNLLQNNKLIHTLETLQKEAQEVAKEVAAADDTMKEVDAVTEDYLPIANMASRVYFALDSLPSIHFLYRFALPQFMHVLFQVIQKNEKLQAIPKSNHDARRKCLIQEFFDSIYQQTSTSLLAAHHPLFALRLVQIRKSNDEKFERLFNHLLRSASIIESRLHG